MRAVHMQRNTQLQKDWQVVLHASFAIYLLIMLIGSFLFFVCFFQRNFTLTLLEAVFPATVLFGYAFTNIQADLRLWIR